LAIGNLVPISARDATVEIATSCAQQRNQDFMRAVFRGRAQYLDRVIAGNQTQKRRVRFEIVCALVARRLQCGRG
jgi:hypothetical protein